MKKKTVWGVYWSATDTTKKTVTAIASDMAEAMGADCKFYNFTLPQARQQQLTFTEDDLVILGVPVYAGRIPNLMLPYVKTIEGNGALGIPVVLFGNRAYEDALIELRNVMEDNHFHTVAGGAFVGQHSFSDVLAAGRPDAEDMVIIHDFAKKAADKIMALDAEAEPSAYSPIDVTGSQAPVYYQPKRKDGTKIDIRKAKPKTADTCDNCGICVKVCPMGSIDPQDVTQVTGICIKCNACIKKCPKNAKYFDDEGYLYHKQDLEEAFGGYRAKIDIFL